MSNQRFDPSESEEQRSYREFRQYAQGIKNILPNSLSAITDLTFEDKKGEMKTAMENMTNSPAERLQASLKYAFVRDAKYALAGGVFLKALGAFQNTRDAYELAKISAMSGGYE